MAPSQLHIPIPSPLHLTHRTATAEHSSLPRASSACSPFPPPSVSSRPPWLSRASASCLSASSVVHVLAPLNALLYSSSKLCSLSPVRALQRCNTATATGIDANCKNSLIHLIT
ncbi:hypothetical protein PIB30_086709 [Stylosanthes scabra]|uniref:Uncharacterized protein n=1 Tax=Stylosanthes scabra TaxID=79078 RepID=A0ABU6TTQ3_9FABA|nr:hypothetical protein [Stylosanthes scabra]